MQAFIWQDNLIGVASAKYANACLHKVNLFEGQTSDQPGGAGRDVISSDLICVPLQSWLLQPAL